MPNCSSNPSRGVPERRHEHAGIVDEHTDVAPPALRERAHRGEVGEIEVRTSVEPSTVAAASRPCFSSRTASTTWAPLRANDRAASRPMPLFPPVTMIVVPVRSGIRSTVHGSSVAVWAVMMRPFGRAGVIGRRRRLTCRTVRARPDCGMCAGGVGPGRIGGRLARARGVPSASTATSASAATSADREHRAPTRGSHHHDDNRNHRSRTHRLTGRARGHRGGLRRGHRQLARTRDARRPRRRARSEGACRNGDGCRDRGRCRGRDGALQGIRIDPGRAARRQDRDRHEQLLLGA